MQLEMVCIEYICYTPQPLMYLTQLGSHESIVCFGPFGNAFVCLQVTGVRPPPRHSHITGLVQKNTLVMALHYHLAAYKV